jgi:hypothetical protein
MSHWLNQHRLSLGAVVLLFLLPYLVFWQVWFPFKSTPLLFEHGDFVEQNVAMRRFVAGEFREGRLPLWDPYTYAGQPALSGSLFAPYYPLGWWQLLFPFPFPDWVLPVEVIFHLGVGGVGTFLLVRRLTANAWAGLISGITFELSGWATGYPMLQVGILETAVWLPWGLWFIERGLARQQWADMAQAALVYGVALLAGHPQTLMYLAYLTAAYYLYRAYHFRVGWRFGIGAGLLIAVGVLGIGAAQWLPAIEAYGYSPRLGLNYEEVGNGFQWDELTGIVLANTTAWSPLYMGVFVCIATIVALSRSRQKELYFWLAVAVIALLVSLGSNGWLYPVAYRLLPGFAIFRNQERIALLFMIAMVILSGYGWHIWAIHLHNPRHRRTFHLFVPIALIITLGNTNFIKILTPTPHGYYPPSPMIEHLRSVGDPTWRISSEGLLPDGPNAGMVYRVRDVVGNSPLHLAALDEFTDTIPEVRWWQLLNIQHILTERTFPENTPVLPIMSSERGMLYQVFVNAAPVWITHQYEVAHSQSAAITRTAQSALDPFQTVILEETPALMPSPSTGNESAIVSIFEPQRLVTEINLTAPALVIWSEIAYPGWVARTNGEALEMVRAYGLLRAVALPAGVHTVEWRFEPPLAYWGLGISVMTLVLLIAIMGKPVFPTLKRWG